MTYVGRLCAASGLARALMGGGCPAAGLRARLLCCLTQRLDAALSMLVVLPLLKSKGWQLLGRKRRFMLLGKVSLKIVVMPRLSLVKDLLYIQEREISNPYKQILLGA